MPHDVTMPQLGMAQDAGKIVSWLKAPGDAVSKGDALLEVETDKAVMEVEAQADGFLTGVKAEAGEDVPVGQVIARISESAEADGEDSPEVSDEAAPASDATPDADPAVAESDDLPDGHSVTMPQLGMAQDTGLLTNWLKSPGDKVAADDVLFEVETDKSTMEVEAGRDGWLAATLAEAGEEVPVGEPVAIISDAEPATTVARSVKEAKAQPAATAPPKTEAPASEPVAPKAAAPSAKAPEALAAPSGGRILASPKARRLALEQGLDLARLAEAGHPQPYHVADLDTLRAMPAAAAPATAGAVAGGAAQSLRLTAVCNGQEWAGFAAWAADAKRLSDGDAVLAGLVGASVGSEGTLAIAVERFGVRSTYSVPMGRALSAVATTDDPPAFILRDLRGTRLTAVALGDEGVPVLTLTEEGEDLSITLECAPGHMQPAAAIQMLTDFAGRMEQPLRHLL